MSALQLHQTRFENAQWEGRVVGDPAAEHPPQIEARHLDRLLSDVILEGTETEGEWRLAIPIPTELIREGVQTIVIHERTSGDKLGDFSLVCGEPSAADLRVEMDLLRAELDMLKRAFRRHCVETR
ncbi:hypothetical protein [Phaeobacter sp.]|uniref:hypothetical protein n=1 Tax=Phaeobacter sp. TaxID=1902409 RepID=UPI0025CE4215|nr:hypothetical protein [Phaeobacter sp.]